MHNDVIFLKIVWKCRSPKAVTYPPMKLLHVTKPKQRCQSGRMSAVCECTAIAYLFHLLSHHIFPQTMHASVGRSSPQLCVVFVKFNQLSPPTESALRISMKSGHTSRVVTHQEYSHADTLMMSQRMQCLYSIMQDVLLMQYQLLLNACSVLDLDIDTSVLTSHNSNFAFAVHAPGCTSWPV